MVHSVVRGRRRLPSQIRGALDSTALLTMVVVLILLARGCVEAVRPDVQTVVALPTAAAPMTPAPFAPLMLNNFHVTPEVMSVGQTAILLNGICNNSDQTVVADIFLAARRAGVQSVLGVSRIELARIDHPGLTLPPGCTPDRAEGPLPDTFTPGLWEIVIQVTAHGPNGELQNINEISNAFEVRGGP